MFIIIFRNNKRVRFNPTLLYYNNFPHKYIIYHNYMSFVTT